MTIKVPCGTSDAPGRPWPAARVMVLVAAAMRLLLPVRRVGFLAVRSRPVDVVLLTGCGLALTVIALAIPAA